MVFTFEKSLSILHGSAPEESGESEVQAPTASPAAPLLFFPSLPFFSHPPHPPHSLTLSSSLFLHSLFFAVSRFPCSSARGSSGRPHKWERSRACLETP